MKIRNIAASLIALALTASTGTTAFADTITKDESDSSSIKATYDSTEPTPDMVISVDIAWGSMDFTYNSNDKQTWNPDTHKYEITKGTPSWSCANGADNITVTNHSNAEINATLTYTEKNASGITGNFDNATLPLLAPSEGSEQSNAPTATAKLTLSGELASTAATKTAIGSVTVTVAPLLGEKTNKYFDISSRGEPQELVDQKFYYYTTATPEVYTAIVTVPASINPTKEYEVGQFRIYTDGTNSIRYYLNSRISKDGTYPLKFGSSGASAMFSFYGSKTERSYIFTVDMRDSSNPTLTTKLLTN